MLNIYHENCSNRCRLAGPSTSHRSGEMQIFNKSYLPKPGSANTVLVLMIFSVRVRRRGQPYLCYIILPWVAVVAEPAEKGLVDAARRLPGFAVGRQVLSTVPQDGVGERHGRSLGEKTSSRDQKKVSRDFNGDKSLKVAINTDLQMLRAIRERSVKSER